MISEEGLGAAVPGAGAAQGSSRLPAAPTGALAGRDLLSSAVPAARRPEEIDSGWDKGDSDQILEKIFQC